MDLSQTFIGHSKYSNQIRISPKPALISAKEQVVQTPKPKNPQIKKCIKRLSAKKLFGHPHVKRYLFDQYRRGCRPNTIRSNFESIILFITHLKSLGRTYLEEVTRDDLGSFIEHQQGCGLKPKMINCYLDSIRGFYEYLIEEEQVPMSQPVKRGYSLKLSRPLPRYLRDEDVPRLFNVISSKRDRAMFMLMLRCGLQPQH